MWTALTSQLHAQALSEARVIWADSTTEVSGALSGESPWLPYIDWSPEALGNLAIRHLETGEVRLLTSDAEFAEGTQFVFYAAVPSPDGSRIAYSWNAGGPIQVRLVPLAGGTPEVVAGGADADMLLHDWAADGSTLLVVRGAADRTDIGFLDLSDGGFRSVGPVGAMPDADLSPDGHYILLSELSPIDPPYRDIRLIDVRTGDSRSLIRRPGDDFSPAWTPAGDGIVFLSDQGGELGLWHAPMVGSALGVPVQVGRLPDAAGRILGVRRDGSVVVGLEAFGDQHVYLGRVDWQTGAVEEVRRVETPPLRTSRRGVFSPDGRSIAFMQKVVDFVVRPGGNTPVVEALDGSGRRAHPTRLTLRDEALWAPDGRALFFVAPPEGTFGEGAGETWNLVRLDLEDSTYALLHPLAHRGLARPAGIHEEFFHYVLNEYDGGGGALFRLDLETGLSTEVYRSPGRPLRDAAVGPDGRIAIALPNNDLAVLEPGDTTLRRIAEIRPNQRPQLTWIDPDEIFLSSRIDGEPGLWRVPVHGGEPRRLGIDGEDVTEARPSPDGHFIAYTRSSSRPREVRIFDRALSGSADGQVEGAALCELLRSKGRPDPWLPRHAVTCLLTPASTQFSVGADPCGSAVPSGHSMCHLPPGAHSC